MIAAADCYQAMTSDRPCGALAAEDAATELPAMSAAGRLDGEAVERVPAGGGNRRAAKRGCPGSRSEHQAGAAAEQPQVDQGFPAAALGGDAGQARSLVLFRSQGWLPRQMGAPS